MSLHFLAEHANSITDRAKRTGRSPRVIYSSYNHRTADEARSKRNENNQAGGDENDSWANKVRKADAGGL